MIRTRLLSALIGAAGLVVLSATLAQAAPTPSVSRYMHTVSTTTGYNEGCAMGGTNASGVVVLDFGEPDYHSSGGWGTYDYGNAFVTNAQIAAFAEQYAYGYWKCSGAGPRLELAVGTSNYGSNVSNAGGVAFGQMVNSINSWLNAQNIAYQISIRGADDMELDWNSVATTEAWENGYQSATSLYLFDYGDLAGCPPYGSCDNGWTQSSVWYKSWGLKDAIPLPEIYYSSQASEWYDASLYSALHEPNGKYKFEGTMTQYAACGSCTYSPAAGYNALSNAINGDSRTTDTPPDSTDISNAN
jgi:hypothetical protein